MNFLATALTWIKEKAIAANEDGIPLPLIRDQHMNGGSLPGTMFFVSFNVAILTLAAKVTKYFGEVEYSNVLWLLGVTGSFWVIEALGKKISIGKDKIEVDASPGVEMSDEIILKEVEVQKLRPRPGDVLVFTLPPETKHSWMHKFAMHLNKILPRVPALFVCGDVKISVITQEEAEKLRKEKPDGQS